MPRTVRFHLDEHVARAIADGLRRRGIDVTSTADANLLGADDGEQVAFAVAQNRVIFTEDEDFLVWAAAGNPHTGVVYCHQNTRSIRQIVRALELIWEVCEPDELANRVEFI
jgi:predicted nuclease of predicted toxin-antitoxin system